MQQLNLITTPNAVDLNNKIEELSRKLLPAYMMFVIGEKAKQHGLVLRDDFFLHMQRHMQKVSEGVDEISLSRASNLTHERANTLLRAVTSNNPIAVLFVVLYSILKAVDEHVITDATCQPVLYSVLLINESEDDGFETTFSKAWVKQKAGEMFSTIYYNTWY
ncbi:hypothetical protein EVC30_137 [Rhizobium phage RHph_Y1_11]|nr:hypothetical protein EVC30_137 [Rhizobium phage RHph_Y1_11]